MLMIMQPPVFTRALLAPRYWAAWFGVAVWFLLAQLPYRIQVYLPHLLVPYLKRNKKRLHQAQTNLQLCFPHLSESERAALLYETLYSTAMAIFETGIAWFWPKWRLRRLFTIRGVEHIEAAKAEGCGALLLSMHFTTLDIGSAMLGLYVNYDGMYSPHKNAVYDLMQKLRREAYTPGGTAFSRDNVREMVSRLRKGRMIWYAPDRDLGEKVSVFVPFFGVQTATVTATAQFARLGRAKIIPFTQKRLPNGKGYELIIHPPFEDYPSGDDYADALRVSNFMEDEISKIPGQYFWAQPRFRTRPDGEPKLY